MYLLLFPLVLLLTVLSIFWNNDNFKDKFLKIFILLFPIYISIIANYYNNLNPFILDSLFEYCNFIITLLGFLFLGSNISININGEFSLLKDFLILLFGSIIASLGGTLLSLILLKKNILEKHDNYFVNFIRCIFFSITICNISGAFSSLGDPPLLIGLMKGVPFLWPMKNLGIITMKILLSMFIFYGFILKFLEKKYKIIGKINSITIDNPKNLILLVTNVVIIFLNSVKFYSTWEKNQLFCANIIGNKLTKTDLIFLLIIYTFFLNNNLLLILMLIKNLQSMNTLIHDHHEILGEIPLLFLGIFLSLSLIEYGSHYNLFLISNTYSPKSVFWITFFISGILDNCPTYCFFTSLFPNELYLKYISLGSVYGGALTPIGNAPNIILLKEFNKKNNKSIEFLSYSIISILGVSFVMLLFI